MPNAPEVVNATGTSGIGSAGSGSPSGGLVHGLALNAVPSPLNGYSFRENTGFETTSSLPSPSMSATAGEFEPSVMNSCALP